MAPRPLLVVAVGGPPTDADFDTRPDDGTLAVDTSSGTTYTRFRGVWTPTASAAARRFKSGLYYKQAVDGADSTVTPSVDVLRLGAFPVGETLRLDRTAIDVATGVATAVGRIGIYADTGDGYPGALVYESATPIDFSVTTIKTETIDVTLAPGMYWVGIVQQVAVATLRGRTTNSPLLMGYEVTATADRNVFTQAGVTGALPATFTSTVTTANGVTNVLLRAV